MDSDPAVVSTLFIVSLVFTVLVGITEHYYLSINPSKIEVAVKQGNRWAIQLQRILSYQRVQLADTIWSGKILLLLLFSGMVTLICPNSLIYSVLLLFIVVAVMLILPGLIRLWLKRLRLGHLFYVLQIVHYYLFLLPTFFSVSLIRRIWATQNHSGASQAILLPYFPKITANKTNDTFPEPEAEVVLLQNALDFSKVKVRDCLIPRTEIVSIPADSTLEELKAKFTETHYSKLLVYSENPENIIGYVHSHDLFKKPKNLKNILLPVFVVPETMNAQELFEQFVKEKRSIAIVLDEFGGTAGMVTIEDVIEEIFGEIYDEHDTPAHQEEQISPTEFLFSGRLEIDYLNNKYGLSIPESENYDTIAGYVLDQLEEIPQAKACLETAQFLITAEQVTDTRIELIRLKMKDEK